MFTPLLWKIPNERQCLHTTTQNKRIRHISSDLLHPLIFVINNKWLFKTVSVLKVSCLMYFACFNPDNLGPIRKSPNEYNYVHVEATNGSWCCMSIRTPWPILWKSAIHVWETTVFVQGKCLTNQKEPMNLLWNLNFYLYDPGTTIPHTHRKISEQHHRLPKLVLSKVYPREPHSELDSRESAFIFYNLTKEVGASRLKLCLHPFW